jgi:hypothetical protein
VSIVLAMTRSMSGDCGPRVVGWIVQLAHSLWAALAALAALAERLAGFH